MKTIHLIAFLIAAFFACTASPARAGETPKEREITVALKVPDGAWKLSIEEIRQVKKEIWVLAALSRDSGVMGIQMISKKQAKVKIPAPDLPVKVFVTGKTWNWKNQEPYKFIENRKEIAKDFDAGKLLYKKPERSGKKAAK